MADKNKNNYLYIGIVVVAVIVLAVVFISNSNNNSQDKNSLQQDLTPQVSSDNFVFLKYSYLNDQSNKYNCNKVKMCEETDGTKFECPKTDFVTIYYKTINLDSTTFLDCTVNDGSNIYRNQNFYYDSSNKIAEINTLLVSYNQDHELITCCKYDDGRIQSDEFCLPKAIIKSYC